MRLVIDKDGVVISEGKHQPFVFKSDNLNNNIDDYPFFDISNGKLNGITVPFSPSAEIYYGWDEQGYICFSFDFFELTDKLPCKGEDSAAIESFISHWTFPIGRTFYKGISRLIPGTYYSLKDGKLLSCPRSVKIPKVNDTSDLDIAQYELFKQSIDSTIAESASEKMNGLFFSGGVDSVLLGLVMQKLNIPFKAYTSNTTPSFQTALEDEWDSSMIALKMGWQHEVITTNLSEIDVSDLDQIFALMPMSSHLCIHFLALSKEMNKQGVEVAFSGQNMDSLYNLGPTSRISLRRSGLADLVRRAFLTSPYFKSLIDAGNDFTFENYVWKLAAKSASKLYSRFKGSDYCPPKDIRELIDSYCSSNDNVVFPPVQRVAGRSADTENVVCQTSQVRTTLLDYKVRNYLMTGSPQAIYQSGNVNGIKVSLPYSDERMIGVFYSLDMSYRDIVFPKRYVYRYIKELAGLSYSELLKGRKKSKSVDYHSWIRVLLEETSFGNSLSKKVDTTRTEKGCTPAQNLQRYLSEYWVRKTREVTNEKRQYDIQ